MKTNAVISRFAGRAAMSHVYRYVRLAMFLVACCQVADGFSQTEADVTSPTEGVITSQFVAEDDMKHDMLQMLSAFMTYVNNDYQALSTTNSSGEHLGYFRGESSGQANEAGVRTNADLSMICAFMLKYAKPAGIALPQGVEWSKVEEMAMRSLVYAYSTHKANKLASCTGNTPYWGSTSASDNVWESSLWAMSVAYSAFFQWDSLTDTQRQRIYAMLKAECNYELTRSIPTGYAGDTKSEENGWEADVLAVTLGLFPDDALAARWFARLRQFAINTYSHTSDALCHDVIDPWYDNKTVADLYVGANLYDDYTLQNHNFFHTSYQNVAMQELGEAALALKLFQTELYGTEKWKTNALMHNIAQVEDSVLDWLILTDGEQAMPNGNDWSLFLFDQIASYATKACFERDAEALTFENLAYKHIKARQTTTKDGSWLLRPDVGARRMGVEAHRVMMTWLMHHVCPTADITPVDFETFRKAHSQAKVLPTQNVVRSFSKDRFTVFSWSNGLKDYAGYFAANSADRNKIVIPYRANNTGNFLGWYTVNNKTTDATPVIAGIYNLEGDGYTMNGELNTNAAALNNRFAIYATPGNAIIYLDYVFGLTSGSITEEKGGLMAISCDEFTKTKRTLYYRSADDSLAIDHRQSNGASMQTYTTPWLNIDNQVGVVTTAVRQMAFGDREAVNSIQAAKLYPLFSKQRRTFSRNKPVDARTLVWYSLIDAPTTRQMQAQLQSLTPALPEGWNAAIAADPDGTHYLLAANFRSDSTDIVLRNITTTAGSPVFKESTQITPEGSATTIHAWQNNSVADVLKVFVDGATDIVASQATDNPAEAYLLNTTDAAQTLHVRIIADSSVVEGEVVVEPATAVKVYAKNGSLGCEPVEVTVQTMTDYTGYIINPSFEGNSAYGWTGSPTVNYNLAEKWNSTFNIRQTIKKLPRGHYRLSVQAFYRDGTYTNANNQRKAGTEHLYAELYAGDEASTIGSIYTHADTLGPVGIRSADYGYVPNTMEQASAYFRRGLYANSVEFDADRESEIVIGVRKSKANANDWTAFDNFQLIRIGDIDDADGIKSPTSDNETRMPVQGIYNMQGYKYSSMPNKGIYVVDGKKVLIM